MHNFDASALTNPVDRRAVREFTQLLKQRFPHSHGGKRGAQIIGVVMLFVIGGGLLLAGVLALIGGGGVAVGAVLVAVGVVCVGVGVVMLVSHGSATTQYRLDRFAEANGLRYHPGFDDPRLPGMLFRVGRDRHSLRLVRGDEPRFVEFGNYRYTTGSGKHSQTHTWGYIAVKLDAPLPNIVLDAEGNNGLFGSNLPIGFDRDQRLGLEGDFDDYFSLYAPEGYETDALYLFTPDIMQRFIRNAAQLDVEIVDDWLFFYTGDDVTTLDADRWAWLFSVVGAMLDKIGRWGRWRDERLGEARVAATNADPVGDMQPALADPVDLRPPKGVADPGKRLKRRGFAWTGIISIIVFIALQVLERVL